MNSENKSDDDVKAGAEILLKGGKMLNKACPQCFSPFYQLEGKVYCVKCKKEFVLVDSKSKMPRNQSKQSFKAREEYVHPDRSEYTQSEKPVLSETAQIIQEKINQLNKELQITTDIKKIKEISSTIKDLVETLKILK